jgi:PBP1b-binding outer membrane lipoprotein LpoB
MNRKGGLYMNTKTIALLLAMILLLAGCSQTAETPPTRKELQQNGVQILEHVEVIGLGSGTYELVSLDD